MIFCVGQLSPILLHVHFTKRSTRQAACLWAHHPSQKQEPWTVCLVELWYGVQPVRSLPYWSGPAFYSPNYFNKKKYSTFGKLYSVYLHLCSMKSTLNKVTSIVLWSMYFRNIFNWRSASYILQLLLNSKCFSHCTRTWQQLPSMAHKSLTLSPVS